jgi:hypothetical protein
MKKFITILFIFSVTLFGQYQPNNFIENSSLPATPNLVAPMDSVKELISPFEFSWNSADSAFSYVFQLSLDSLFSLPLETDSSLTDTSLTLTDLLFGTEYFWRVKAVNDSGSSDWSVARVFETLDFPDGPDLSFPQNNAVNIATTLNFKWFVDKNNFSKNGFNYWFELSLDSTFSTLVLLDSTLTDTIKSVSNLYEDSLYFWRVKKKNVLGWGVFSDIWRFTTALEKPEVPVLLSPIDSAKNITLNPQLLWLTSDRAVTYNLQVSTDSTFGYFVYNQTGVTDTFFNITNLDYLTDYFWRVKSLNIFGSSEWSSVFNFETIIEKPTDPILVVPGNNSAGLLNPITVKWLTSERVEKYYLQLSTDSLFSSFIVDDSTLTDTLFALPALANYTKYFWRVKALNIGGESDWSSEWNFKTLGNPYSTNLISPIDESENQPINGLVFKWNKSEERIEAVQNYHFQLSTDSLFSTLVEDDSLLTDTTTTINGLTYYTEYYWRVRGSNQIGWGDWSDVWETTTIIEKPSVPLLSFPLNNSVGLLNPLSAKWFTSERVEKYYLQLSTDSLFSSLIVNDSTLTDTLLVLPVLSNYTKYFWRVKAINVGGESDWSSEWNFKTLGNPNSTILISPTNESVNQLINSLEFTWNKSEEQIEAIQNYQFQLSTDSLFNQFVVNDSLLTDTLNTISGLTNLTNYFWRVRASNETGWGDWSAIWRFTTIIEKPTDPILVVPGNNSAGLLNPITVKWLTSERVEKYYLQLSTDSLFGSFIVDDSTLTDTLFALPALANYTKYFWRVKALNIGGESDWSSEWNFKTLGNPYSTNLISPIDESENQPINGLVFKWNKSEERIEAIQNYHFQLSTDSLFSTLVEDDSLLTDTTTTINGLTYYTEYYWRVRGSNQIGWGDWSDVWETKTIIEKPEITLLVSPINGINGLVQPITLVWNSSVRAEKYELEVSSDSLFGTIVYTDTTLTDTTIVLPDLANLTTYYWRIRAKNIGGMSDNSEVRNFRTIGVPTSVSLLFPQNDSIHVPINVNFAWTSASDQLLKTISNYWFELTKDTTGGLFVNQDSTLTDTTILISNLDFLTNYFWRVKSKNEAGWGNFTEWNKFTTIIEKPEIPILATPLNGANGLVQPVTLVWNSSLRTEKYELEVSADSLFGILTYSDTTLTDTITVLPELPNLTTYYWRIRAKNIGGISNYSNLSNFRTIGVPIVVNLLYPRNDSIHVPINTNFYWSKASDQLLKTVSNYWFELTKDTTGGLFVNQDSTLTDTTTLVNNLDFLTDYFWRVKSKNEAGWGNFSGWNKFTTIIEKPEIPLLESPLSGTNGLVQPITLLWNSSIRAEKYELEVSSDSLFGTIVYSDTTLTDTTKILPDLANLTTYYWRIRAKNIGGMSENSEVRNFRTIGVPTNVSLLIPRNDSIHVPLNVDFAWTKSEDQILKTVSNYWFQLTSDTSSGSFVSNDSTLTDTVTTVNGLDYFTNYYWRVKSINEAGWSEFTGWFTFKTIIEKPDQIVLSQPNNNSIGVIQPATLSWLVSDRAEKYELEVADDSLFSSIVYTDTTIIETSHILPILQNLTNYYWRVRGKNIGGIGDYSTTFTFRTLGVPTVVNLIWPVDTSIHQNISQTFIWTKALDQLSKTVSHYWFELSVDTTSNLFVVQDSTLSDTTIFVENLEYLTPYYWRVKAENEAGWGDFSGWNKFTTIIERPVTPLLISPPDSSDGLVKPITFIWGSAERGEYYHFQIATDSEFTQVVVEDTSIFSLQISDSSLNDLSTYYWRVRAVNIGGKSDFASPFSFRTLGVPYPVVLNYPAADSINLPVSITFDWFKGTDQRTVSTYWFELVRDTISQTGLIRDTTVTDTAKTVSGLINLTNYYWRVKAQNEIGWGAFSDWRKFTTIILPPATPVLHSPGSADIIQVGVTQPITFKWLPALRVERYHIEVSRDELFRTNDYADSTLTDTSVVVPHILQDLEFYYWRVRAINVGGSSAYSTVFKFKTIGTPNTVILSVPTANTVNQPINNLTFKWFKATEQRSIGRYWFEMKQDTSSSTFVIRDTSVTDTFKVVNGLQYLNVYYWRVRAENEAGWSGFSFWRKFTTIIQKPDSVVLSSPENESINQDLLITLVWFKSARAERYELRVARDSAFTQLVDSSDVLTDTSYTLGPLSYFTNYYWRVRAVNINSPGEYSPKYSFSTLLPATTLISPANNSVDLTRNITFRWNAANGASHYKLQIAASTAFSNIIIDTTISSTSVTLGPLTNNSTYYWRVRSVNGSSNSAYTSPFKFTVYEPVLTILTPNGGESLRSGSSKDIKWNVRIPTEQLNRVVTKSIIADDNEFTTDKSDFGGDGSVQSNFSFVIIQYSTNNGNSWVNIDSLIPGSQETYNWIVPSVSSEECKIRILDFTNRDRGDTTDAAFTIYKPSLVLTHPNTAVVWRSASQQTIQWTSNDVQTVRVDFSTNNGASWFTIKQSQPADSGKYTWTVPALTSTECKIRILADNNLAVGDTSDVPFTVAVPVVTLLSPIGGENWETEINYEIKWTSQYSEWFKIVYSTNNGLNWLTVTDSVSALVNSFNWIIPNTPSTNVKLRIYDGEDSSFSDTSGIFTIYRPGITVLNPIPGEQIKVGIRKTIQWESNDVNAVVIEYSIDNGENWQLIASNVSSFAGGIKSYEWTVPNSPSETCIIKITDAERPNIYGLSSGNFTIYILIPRIFTTLFQNPVLTRYAEVVVISDTLLSETPFVQITGPTDTSTIDMSQTGNSKFAYNGSVQFKASGSYTLFVSIKTVQGIENDTSRNFNVEQVIPGKPAVVKSLDNKSRLLINGNELDETTFFVADMEKSIVISENDNLINETVYMFSPVRELSKSLVLEFDYSDFKFKDEGKIFIYQEIETPDGIIWQPLRSQVFTSTKTIKSHVYKLGKFKLGYDAEFSGSNIVPNEFKVAQNYPNPFNPETNINYSIPVDGDLSIIVYDVLGREVEVLKSEFTLAGQYNTKWSASKNASGIYFLVIRIAEYRDIKKMVLMK